VLWEQRAALGVTDMECRPVVLKRCDAAEHETAQRYANLRSPRQCEPEQPFASGCEDLNALLPPRRVGDGKGTVRGHVERARFDDAPFLMADLNQLRRAGSCAVDAVDSVPATVEHEVLARCRPLKGNRI